MARPPRSPRNAETQSAQTATSRTAGMALLAAVVRDISASALRDIDAEALFEGNATELSTYRFIRSHFDEHRVIPTKEIIRENTGVQLPPLPSNDAAQPISYYHGRCRQRAMMRNAVEPYNRLQDALANPRESIETLEIAIDDLYQMKTRFLRAGSGIELSDTLIERVINESNERRMSGGTLSGITTGWPSLDAAMDGYNRDDLVVWVGRPGRGKSWFLLRQAYEAWTAGYKPLYISMEMGGTQNMRRILGLHSGVNPTLIKRGQIGTLAMPLLEARAQELLRLRPLHMVTANFSRTVDQIANFVDEYTPDIVYIDAGYLLTPRKKRFGSGGRRETISDVIEEIKEMSGNFGIPFVITVQFNRNAEQRRRGANANRREGSNEGVDPIAHLSLAEIGETDVIGQAASHVLGIEYPPFPVPQNAYRVFGFLKGREGETGWWATNYPASQHSPVNMDLLLPDHPVYAAIRASGSGNSQQRSTGRERSAAMRLQD